MTLWEISAAFEGWTDAHVDPSQRAVSDEDREDMIDFLEEYRKRHGH
jgi:hypothetical protein